MAALCVRYILNQQDAVQVLNDGFLKVFRNIQTYDADKAGIYSWIRKIMINTAIDFLRRKPIVYTTDIAALYEESGIENSVVHKMDADDLLDLIHNLPKATQLVFNLYTVEGYSHREIGEILGISEGTSKWHLSEARKRLKESVSSMQKIK